MQLWPWSKKSTPKLSHPGPEAFYGLLMPFLNEKPLSANASDSPSWLEQLPIPVAGDAQTLHTTLEPESDYIQKNILFFFFFFFFFFEISVVINHSFLSWSSCFFFQKVAHPFLYGTWPPPSGDRSGAICVERSVRFALVLAGMDSSAASWWSGVGLRGLSLPKGHAKRFQGHTKWFWILILGSTQGRLFVGEIWRNSLTTWLSKCRNGTLSLVLEKKTDGIHWIAGPQHFYYRPLVMARRPLLNYQATKKIMIIMFTSLTSDGKSSILEDQLLWQQTQNSHCEDQSWLLYKGFMNHQQIKNITSHGSIFTTIYKCSLFFWSKFTFFFIFVCSFSVYTGCFFFGSNPGGWIFVRRL